MGLYSKQGLYAGYKKNNKEREALDYYATPPQEVTNILEILNLDLDNATILEPCCGEGHIIDGLVRHVLETGEHIEYTATDIRQRGWYMSDSDSHSLNYGKRKFPPLEPGEGECNSVGDCKFGLEYDFLSDDYPYNQVDYIIMNPPFTTIEPFVIRALEIAQKGLLMFGRLQFLEGQGRYENILKKNPPSDVYVYVDRVKCGKNGNFADTEAIQAYAWYWWNKTADKTSQLHWIRRK